MRQWIRKHWADVLLALATMAVAARLYTAMPPECRAQSDLPKYCVEG